MVFVIKVKKAKQDVIRLGGSEGWCKNLAPALRSMGYTVSTPTEEEKLERTRPEEHRARMILEELATAAGL